MATYLVGPRPREVTFTPDGKAAFVTTEIGRQIFKFDTTTNRELAQITLEDIATKPKGIVHLPSRGELWVTTGRGNSVVVLGSDDLELRATIPVGKRVWGIARSPDDRRVYTADGLDNAVSVIDVASRAVVGTIAVGEKPWGLAYVAR
ncbi:MAG: hypothetical protein HKP27_13260 [Myxococcales bacterium]|nr:hypothetical protein [Myxococcales bacterium]